MAAAAARPIAITEIKAAPLFWGDLVGPTMSPEDVAGALRVELAPYSDLLGDGDGEPPAGTQRARLKVQYGLDAVPAKKRAPGKIAAAVGLRLEWSEPSGPQVLESKVATETPVAVGDKRPLPEAARAAFGRTMANALEGLATQERVRRGDEAAVIAALDSPDEDVRRAAFRAVEERRISAAVPRLIELLGSEDPMLRDRAIGALVELRDERAVKPLAELAKFRDLDMMRRLIDAIGTIGGDEAEAYLDLVATGHEHPEVRELARQALERLQRRGGKRAP